jgi:radical SAM protein with 4Fe4S-binding SPASM domain
MEFALFKKIIDEWAPHLRYLSFDGPGETIMNPDAFPMIRYAKSKGIRVMFSTNATRLDADITDSVISSGVDLIIFSLNGTTPEVYEAVHGRPCYEETVTNIRRFIARKLERRSPILVSLQMIRLPDTLPQVRDFYRQWQHISGVDFVRIKKDVVCHEDVSVEEGRRQARRRNPCSRLWHGPIFIETNGDVYPSPGVLYKTAPIGNAARESLAQIWNNESMKAMRRAHICGDLSTAPECLSCAYPRPLLPLILAGFLLDPFIVGKFVPLAEKLAFWHHLPLYEKIAWKRPPRS